VWQQRISDGSKYASRAACLEKKGKKGKKGKRKRKKETP
jgi:hypothetical protein